MATHESEELIVELLRSAINNYDADQMSAAFVQFFELAECDCEEALLYLSLMYRHGDGVEKDELEAVRYKKRYVQTIEAKAAGGDPAYQFELAKILEFGDGVKIDSVRAFELYLLLAKTGWAAAQFHLSRIYAHGNCGQNADTVLEWRWLDEAVKSEWPMALYYSALFLESTSNTPALKRRVHELMSRASELGCWQAKQHLEATAEATGSK